MKNTRVVLLTFTALATGCQVGDVTEVGEPVAVPIVLGGFDEGDAERQVGELVGDELRLAPDFAAALGEEYGLRLAVGGMNVELDPADPVVSLSPRPAPDEPIRLVMSDEQGEVATLELQLGDPEQADDDLIYHHTCPSGSGVWWLAENRYATGSCGICGAGKRRMAHLVAACHGCSDGSSACSIVHFSEYCDYC
jgi:hypothetical protein